MASKTEFDGGQCMVLSKDYLQSARAASEIYEDGLSEIAGNLDVDNLTRRRGFFHGTFVAAVVWLAPSIWSLCH